MSNVKPIEGRIVNNEVVFDDIKDNQNYFHLTVFNSTIPIHISKTYQKEDNKRACSISTIKELQNKPKEEKLEVEDVIERFRKIDEKHELKSGYKFICNDIIIEVKPTNLVTKVTFNKSTNLLILYDRHHNYYYIPVDIVKDNISNIDFIVEDKTSLRIRCIDNYILRQFNNFLVLENYFKNLLNNSNVIDFFPIQPEYNVIMKLPNDTKINKHIRTRSGNLLLNTNYGIIYVIITSNFYNAKIENLSKLRSPSKADFTIVMDLNSKDFLYIPSSYMTYYDGKRRLKIKDDYIHKNNFHSERNIDYLKGKKPKIKIDHEKKEKINEDKEKEEKEQIDETNEENEILFELQFEVDGVIVNVDNNGITMNKKATRKQFRKISEFLKKFNIIE